MSTLWLSGGMILDGSGGEPFPANVLVENGRIADIGPDYPPRGEEAVDCSGLFIAPGFIDVHSHSDLQVLENRPEKLLQGVTAEVVGNCGFSPYPAADNAQELREFANGIFCGGDNWGWPDARAYLSEIRDRSRTHALSLVGHGSLRIAYAGHQLGTLSAECVAGMVRALDESLEQGAAGLSTGLMYSPGASAPVDELDALCRVVARHGKVYATHMRDYGDELEEAVDEQIGIARRTECRLQISHFQAVGPRNWPRQGSALGAVDRARREGIDVAFDCYPYTRGSTMLLPQSSLEGGMSALLGRLKNIADRQRISAETERPLAQGWAGIIISALASEKNRELVGLSVAQIAQLRHTEPVTAALDLLVEENGAVNILEINQSDENLRETLTHPLSMVISDGFYVNGLPHPRLYGTFPYLLGEICRKRGWLTLAEAVHKITDVPARRFGLGGRGLVAKGYRADLTIFHPLEVGSPATYDHPTLPPTGIRHVLRDGELLLRDGHLLRDESEPIFVCCCEDGPPELWSVGLEEQENQIMWKREGIR